MVISPLVLQSFQKKRVLVVGDLLLDRYIVGRGARLSPEAPVPIVSVERDEVRAGGAGNVLLNLLSLGAEVTIAARVGLDEAGACLRSILREEGIDLSGLVSDPTYLTPVKSRVIANSQQIVRFDREEVKPLSSGCEMTILEQLPALMQRSDIVALSDYGKGTITASLAAAILEIARQMDLPVVIDPKGEDFSKYRGCTLIKPNLSEAYAATRMPRHTPLDVVAGHIFSQTDAQALMITRSEEGISLFYRDGAREDHPVVGKVLRDPTGAGDTALAMCVYAMAQKCSYGESAVLANVAAGIAIETVGCACVSLEEVRRRISSTHSHAKGVL
jgi:D-beta-D-heptose 7-phosphate kinase/D-beta-D-heptose 1-phosphate adenosyltransferase